MIDVNKITSTLAKLSDVQLQTYAKMNPDPYTIALAVAESNRRKELRDAASAQQGMQEQPKVVDQMVAEMAPQQMPEEMGIGRLPAGNMNFANGGIIAFAGGGDVEHYQFGGSTGSMYDSAKARAAAAQQKLYSYGLRQRQLDPAGFQAAQQELAAAQEVLQTAKQGYERDLTATGLNRPAFSAPTAAAPIFQEAPAASAAAPVNYDPTENLRKIAQTNAKYVTPAAPTEEAAVLAQRYPKPRTGEAAPTADTGKKITGIGAPAAAPRTAATQPVDAGPQGIDALLDKYQRQTDLNIGQARNATAQYAKSLEDEGAAFVEAEKKRIAEKVDPYKGREERLNKREGELEGMGSKYAGLALLQAGAAMMSTPGGIGMALGKGVQVGSERYAAGIEKINAAKEKFAEARERLDDLRINRADMDARDIRDAEKEARLLKRQGKELFYSGAKDELNMKDKQITAMLGVAASALNTDKQIAAERENTMIRERGAYARAGAPSADMREAMLLGTGSTDAERYLSGLKVKQALLGDKQGTQLFRMFLEENGRREKAGQDPMSLEQFRRQSASFFAPPAPVDTGKPTRP